MKKNIITVLLALLTILGIYLLLDYSNYFKDNDSRDHLNGYVVARYISVDHIENASEEYDIDDGYYISFFIENHSDKNINSSFIIELDAIYKDQYIIKNKEYTYDIPEKKAINSSERQIIYIKISKEKFEQYKDLEPLSDDVITKIISFTSEEDIKWLKE